MQISATHTNHRIRPRVAYGALSALLLAAAIAHGGGWWYFGAFVMAPDLALFLGIDPALEKGRLHPRAVPVYNALHSYAGPALLGIAALGLGSAWTMGAIAWALHISLDRAIGYGKRTRDGYQRS
jgi:hypothetical protein